MLYRDLYSHIYKLFADSTTDKDFKTYLAEYIVENFDSVSNLLEAERPIVIEICDEIARVYPSSFKDPVYNYGMFFDLRYGFGNMENYPNKIGISSFLSHFSIFLAEKIIQDNLSLYPR